MLIVLNNKKLCKSADSQDFKVTDLHYLDELEKQLLSVLGFLLLNYQRADPKG